MSNELDLALLRSLSDRIGLVEQKLAEQKGMFFEGAHDPSRSYQRGACVQKGGITYIALMSTSEAPGASDHWRGIAQSKGPNK